jgi:hypothetical protein
MMYLNDSILMGQYPAYIHIIEAVETGTTGKGVGRRYDLGVVMCRAGLGSSAPAWARLGRAWAHENLEPGPGWRLGLGSGWAWA